MRPEYTILYTSPCGNFRITEHADTDFDLEDLKGDSYNPKVNPDIDADVLKNEETQFEALVEREGVFGYVLERWNPSPGMGWEHLDSCWGFVGQYDESSTNSNHYIVDEMKAMTERQIKGAK